MEDINIICPLCKDEVILDTTPEIGEIVYCPHCQASLEVLKTVPITLKKITLEEGLFTEEEKEEKEDLDNF